MKDTTRMIIRIYSLKDYDFMGYKLIKNQATYHHILKKEDGGLETLENGAVLMPIPHEYLHVIEAKDYELYLLLNRMLKIINLRQSQPSLDDYRIISQILHIFEERHSKDRTKKGKQLIKRKFLERDF